MKRWVFVWVETGWATDSTGKDAPQQLDRYVPVELDAETEEAQKPRITSEKPE